MYVKLLSNLDIHGAGIERIAGVTTTTLQVSSIIVCFRELISALLSSASESVQPGLINLGPVSVKCRLQTRGKMETEVIM